MLPALVVGLGGTGSWALAYFKRRLLTDSHWGLLEGGPAATARDDYDRNRWPIEIKAIDVDRKHRPNVGGLRLDKAIEDIALTAPVGKTITDIAASDRAYPTIQQWLPREEARDDYDINEATLFMTEGLGQIRSFGRIAFFYEQVNNAQELSKLDAAFTRLTKGDDIQVFVVASVAGGTGAGLLIDTLGYLSTQRAKLPGQVSVRATGIIALPGAFRGELFGAKMDLAQANGMATLRELDRLLNAHETVEFEWRPGVRERLQQPALDFCYLVDGSREQGNQSQQLDAWKPVEQAIPAAMGDALYTHVFPSTGAVLGRDYANYTDPLIAGAENRYASFGSYVIAYDWERLMGSLGLRAVDEVLTALRGQAPEYGRQQVAGFLATGATGPLALGALQQRVPALSTSGLSSIPDPQDFVVPGDGWLTPAGLESAANVPSTPQLADHFPGIRVMRTDYTNPQVVADVEGIVDSFLGSRNGTWNRNSEPKLHEALNHNAAQSLSEWRRALTLAAAAIMNANGRVGGVSAAREFLVALEVRLEQLGTNLSRATQPDLTAYKQAVIDAEEAMHDGRRFDDWKEQKDYLAARQDLLEEEIRLACYQTTNELIGLMAHATAEVKEGVAGWDLTLERLQASAREERTLLDDERQKADLAPLQRFVPQPGEPIEQALYNEHWGSATDGRIPDGLSVLLESLTWDVEENPNEPLEIRLGHANFQGREATLADLRAAALTPFMPLRGKSVMALLQEAGTDADRLAQEIRSSMSCLATYDPNKQLQATGGQGEFRNADYVFAYWPSEQQDNGGPNQEPGAALSGRLRDQLARMGVSTEDLPATTHEGNYPAADKIIAYSVRPLMALEAFTGVQVLATAYHNKRDYKPPTHLLPQERGAAEMELLSEQMVRDGLIDVPLERLRSKEVGYCADRSFLRYAASALSAGLIAYEQEDPFDPSTGRWYVEHDGESVELAKESDLGAVLTTLMNPATATLERARELVRAAGRQAAREDGARERLLDFAKSGWHGEGDVPPTLVRLLQVSAAFAAQQLKAPDPARPGKVRAIRGGAADER